MIQIHLQIIAALLIAGLTVLMPFLQVCKDTGLAPLLLPAAACTDYMCNTVLYGRYV